MHMVMVIAGGLILLGVFLLFGQLWGVGEARFAVAASAFVPVWLLVTIVNLWIGVSRAGYSVWQELPILLIVFCLPAAAAAVAIVPLFRS